MPRRADVPIYIVSKGRADVCYTARHLARMGVAFSVVVEEQEHDAYAATLGAERLLVLDSRYQREYDTCDALGATKSRGPGPARNFAWAHSLARGAAWHWVMDDNIRGWMRLNRNLKVPVADGACFRAMQDFCARYTNVAMAGPNYEFMAKHRQKLPPFVANTRIYSCNLIRNDLPFRWRGRYNEDTDLSLRILKAGLCTVQFNAFLQMKCATQTVRGGNTKEFYDAEGTLAKSNMQVALHPDVSTLVFKFGRCHHHVDYAPFRSNKLVKRSGVAISAEPDEYGMQLVSADDHSAPAPARRSTRAKRVAK